LVGLCEPDGSLTVAPTEWRLADKILIQALSIQQIDQLRSQQWVDTPTPLKPLIKGGHTVSLKTQQFDKLRSQQRVDTPIPLKPWIKGGHTDSLKCFDNGDR